MKTVIDIIRHANEDESVSWGLLYDDGSVKWYETLEEASYYMKKEER